MNVAKFEEKGIALTIDEEVENREAHEENCPLWHLLLMCVDEPTNIRICHDAKGVNAWDWTSYRRPQLDQQLGRSFDLISST